MKFLDYVNLVRFVDLMPGDVFINSDGKIVMKVHDDDCPWNAVELDSGLLDIYFDTIVYKVNATCTLDV